MKLKQINIDKIKPDKNQPRKSFDEGKLSELSESILSNGMYEPIEIDQNNIIIDGERRWKACKIAKIKDILCKIITIKNKEERLRRQLILDLQDESIGTAEKYQAIWNLYEMGYPDEAKSYANRIGGANSNVSSFARTIGKSQSYVTRAFDYLDLKKEEPELVEGIAPSLVGETKKLDKEERKEVLKEMKEGGIKKTIEDIREAVKEKKSKKELDEKNKELQKTNEFQVKINTTKEILDDITTQIHETQDELNKLMVNIRRIRKTKFYFYKAKEKEGFFRTIDGVITRAEKWVIELKDLKDNIELEVIRE